MLYDHYDVAGLGRAARFADFPLGNFYDLLVYHFQVYLGMSPKVLSERAIIAGINCMLIQVRTTQINHLENTSW